MLFKHSDTEWEELTKQLPEDEPLTCLELRNILQKRYPQKSKSFIETVLQKSLNLQRTQGKVVSTPGQVFSKQQIIHVRLFFFLIFLIFL